MAINRVVGQMLQSTLARDGNNLSVSNLLASTPALLIDVNNNRIGINVVTANAAIDATGGNILSGNISTTGNVATFNVLTNNYLFANGIPVSFDGTYSNANVANYLPTYSGNIGGGNANITGNIQSANANIGNLTVANITITGDFALDNISVAGNITGGNITAVDYLDTANLSVTGNAIIPTILSTGNANINITPDGTGVVNIGNSVGILMGNPTLGNLVSNAVTLTTATPVNTGIAQLNTVLGKLVPPSPPAFPASQTIAISTLSTYRIANITQTNNTANSLTVSAGATVSTVRRAATYSTNTINTAGPGDSGTVTVYRNGTDVGNVTLTGSSNGTYGGNLVITNNQDYNSSNSSITRGFWSVFSAAISGTNAPAGWNDVTIVDSAAGNTNVPSWYYDNYSTVTPTFSGLGFAPSSTTVTYSSTVPHYTSATQFTLDATVANVSGNMYPTTDTFFTGTSGGAFTAPVSVTYQSSSLGTNVLDPAATATVSTTSNVIAGFGTSSTGPSVSVNNSYATGTQAFTTTLANTVLYKTGSTSSLTFLDEGNIFIGSTIGSGSGTAFRIVNPSGNVAVDTPAFTGTEAAFDSQNGPLYDSDATVVANTLKNDTTNYASGYLPAGPNINPNRNIAQYFTFKFVRTSTSKFDIQISTGVSGIAGLWVALPGSLIDSTSGANGWISGSQIYAGSGVPGSNIGAGGNGSDGCSLGGVVPLNTSLTADRTTITFGTVSSSSTATNEIYVRIKLTSGQTVSSLSLQTASN